MKILNNDLRVLSIFGTRAEAVKMAPVVRALNANPNIESLVCVTAQHRQMLDQVLDIFEIKPDIDLDLMRHNQTLSELTASIFTHLDPVLAKYRPHWVLVLGDTTTVMAAALLAYYHRMRVGHIEAGLRTGDKWQPFPEEVNRRVAGIVADLHFAPTEQARQNLLKEGFHKQNIQVTGNPVIDALKYAAQLPPPDEVYELFAKLGLSAQTEPQPPDWKSNLILITAHRRENFGQPLENICRAIIELAEFYPDYKFVYPVHLNPNVQEPVSRLLGGINNIVLLPPLDYLPMVNLLKRARLLLTDSGGLQEEAPGLGIPTLVMRNLTERPEGVEAGTLRLVGADADRIITETQNLLDDEFAYKQMANAVNPYGDGRAAQRIVQSILKYEI